MQRDQSLKILLGGSSVLILALCILPFFWLTPYIQPQYDDFGVWIVRSTHSFFEAQWIWYMKWSGRFSAFFLISFLHPIIYRSLDLLGIAAAIIQVLFPLAIFLSLKNLLPRSVLLTLTLPVFAVVLMSYYWKIPSPAEAFFWIPSTFSYQLGLILIIFLFGFLWSPNSLHNKNVKILLILLCFFIPGTSEISILLVNALLGVTLLYQYIEKKEVNRFLIGIFALSLIMSVISAGAPGNAARAEVLKNLQGTQAGDVMFSLKGSFVIIKTQLLELFLKSPLIPVTLLFILLISFHIHHFRSEVKGRYIPLYFLLWIGIYVLLHFPFIYKAGIVFMPGRVLNVTQFFFISGWFGLVTLILRYYKNTISISPILLKLTVLLFVPYIFIQLLMPNKILSALQDGLSGRGKEYSQQMDERYAILENSKGADVRVEPLRVLPHTIHLTDINTDTSNECNTLVAKYFGLNSIKIDSSLSESKNSLQN